jgi:hypothetical protein
MIITVVRHIFEVICCVMEMDRAYRTNGEERNAYRILVGKPQGKRPLGRPRCRWEDNIKIDLRKMGWYGLDGSGSG